jgi:elongation factor Ts
MITAGQVKELREATGVGMMECKKALEECQGDMKKALTFLREKGLAKAAKKSGRVAAEGVVAFALSADQTEAAIIELNCETDFAGKNQSFRDMSKQLAQLVLSKKINSVEEAKNQKLENQSRVADELINLISTIGENINLRRVQYVHTDNGFIVGYNHMQGKIASLVVFEGNKDAKALEVGADIAMHVAATSPRYMERSQISATELEEEKKIFRKQILDEGKPEQMVEKILEGQIKKFYADSCLLDQPFVKEPKLSVSQFLKNSSASTKLTKFVRYQLGEGIEVTKTDFEHEVSQLIK